TLPASWYGRDESIYRRELDRIFAGVWQYHGRLEDVFEPDEALGRIREHLSGGGIELDRLRFHCRDEWLLDVNWKVGVENYLECYHCPVAHPGFSEVVDVDPDTYRLEAEGLVMSQFAPARDPVGPIRLAQFHLLWPNTAFNVEPGPPNLSID